MSNEVEQSPSFSPRAQDHTYMCLSMSDSNTEPEDVWFTEIEKQSRAAILAIKEAGGENV